ncbi:type IV pilus modification PilV family protein [Deinococcus radiotolerans]|uniref:Prepilin-type N-terminal cleavage/methylation domain-containing protein n=1 Tax=Deinococcus radiotolerans TaxID=1309407 RepID=A0ABQ2FLG6_9DEIO|nr:type II secretion system protein [Deinococcus radiotolerans]GGL01381.1 hypothetical protein GCM10010844_19770 [Deinococcus radiotolerans]
MNRDAGLTIVEILVAIVIVGVITAAVMPLLTSSMRSNSSARTRTQAVSAAETWMERYRDGREPLKSVGSCTENISGVVTCTYPLNFNYANDTAVPTHTADGASMNSQFQPFKSVLVATPISEGINVTLWELKVTVSWTEKEEKSVTAYTRFTR